METNNNDIAVTQEQGTPDETPKAAKEYSDVRIADKKILVYRYTHQALKKLAYELGMNTLGEVVAVAALLAAKGVIPPPYRPKDEQ